MKTDEKEVSVRADVEKNRLYTTLKGVLTEKDIAALHDDLRREADILFGGRTGTNHGSVISLS